MRKPLLFFALLLLGHGTTPHAQPGKIRFHVEGNKVVLRGEQGTKRIESSDSKIVTLMSCHREFGQTKPAIDFSGQTPVHIESAWIFRAASGALQATRAGGLQAALTVGPSTGSFTHTFVGEHALEHAVRAANQHLDQE